VGELSKPGRGQIAASQFKVPKCAVTPLLPAFLIKAAWVRAEQHAIRFQSRAQFQQHAWQLLAWDVKQRGVGEYAIEAIFRQIELEKILLPHFTTAVDARHCRETRGAVQTHREMAKIGKGLKVTAGPAKIKYRERWLAIDMLQQRHNILADVVVAGACPEVICTMIVLVRGSARRFALVLMDSVSLRCGDVFHYKSV
jgi:hypothetical protein